MGKKIGSYEIVSKIAEGGFGTTYKAMHSIANMPVCIKHSTDCSDEDEKILVKEAQSIWNLRHYGVPAIMDIIRVSDKSLALVMSYIPDKNLAEVLEDHPNGLEPEDVAWICSRTLNVLKYLHMHGVIHGDMKPQNMMIQQEEHLVTLVDYGLASIRPTAMTESIGYTPYFAAPEQIAGKTPIPETDLYGLGMSMIFALGGDVEKVKVPATTPDNMVKFIKDLIRRDPLQRPKIWKEDLCETFRQVRLKDFGRDSSGMKPFKKK